ncbi:MAG: hypothetical protein K0S95_99 [Pantoea eucrina]|nr:hypothetical protein [Pantoea eucrina]
MGYLNSGISNSNSNSNSENANKAVLTIEEQEVLASVSQTDDERKSED